MEISREQLQYLIIQVYTFQNGYPNPKGIQMQLKSQNISVTQQVIKDMLRNDPVFFQNKRPPVVRNFRKVSVEFVDQVWTADLAFFMEYQPAVTNHKGIRIKYLLIIMDVFSRYVWIYPLIDKSSHDVSFVFE